MVVRRSALATGVLLAAITLAACAKSEEPGSGNDALQGAVAGTGGPNACGTWPIAPCNGVCTDMSADSFNCGACGQVCTQPTVCAAGQCVCPQGTLPCNGACVDPARDQVHCGACGNTCFGDQVCDGGQCREATSAVCTLQCGAGRSCVNGSCVCPQGTSVCEQRCVDLQASPDDCGTCGVACTGGQTCNSGACACPLGQSSCDGLCTDFAMSAAHCGGCGQACEDGEACMAGTCHAPVGADGCGGISFGLARGLSISDIDVYQSTKVPVMQGGSAITFDYRNADVIQGHDAIFRVSVTLESGFAARELSARVTMYNGAGEDQYFAKQRVDRSSNEADTASTFQVRVPAERLNADTRFSVEVAECGSSSGSMVAPRFPATGDVELEAVETGVLRIVVVPVRANNRSPDTSPATLELYREYFMATYPIRDVEIGVTNEISTGYPIDWSDLLDQIRDKRAQDGPEGDVYYYGMLTPSNTYQDYCATSCTVGIGMVVSNLAESDNRAAVGLAFGDERSAWTMAHEVAHNHGRNHAPCGGVADADPGYPYSGASIGDWGYDERRDVFIDPDDAQDMMGYCDPKWISDYTYLGLSLRLSAVHTSFARVVDSSQLMRWRVLLIDAAGARWGRPLRKPALPFGTEEVGHALDANGNVIEEIPVYRTPVADGSADSATLLVPEPQPGCAAVRVRGKHLPIDVYFDRP